MARLGRLSVGWAAGALVMSGVLSFVTVAASAGASFGEDEGVVVAFEEPPPPEPEPEVKAPEPKPEAPKPAPRRKVLAVVDVPDDAPSEKDPAATDQGADEDPFADQGPAAPEPPKPAVVAPPPPPPPPPPRRVAPRGPIQVTENVTPPEAVSMTPPAYPPDAKAQGIEGIVIVKYVVAETGEVTSVQVVRGPEALAHVCVAAVKGWRFRPALLEGQPVAVHRVARFPFRIRT